MSSGLKGKYPGAALVTGASAGIGESFVRRLAAEGMDVVLVARRQSRLESLAREIRERHGVKTYVVSQDLSEPNAASRIKAKTDELGLHVSVLVNNAGFGTYGRFQETSLERQLEMIELNCRSYVAMTGAFLPPMLEKNNGAIVMTASTAAFQPVPNFATYGATKAFNLSFGEALASDLEGTGIDVLTLCPSYTRTEFHQAAHASNLPEGINWAEPREVVNAAFTALGVEKVLVHRAAPPPPDPMRKVRNLSRRVAASITRKVGVPLQRFGLFMCYEVFQESFALITAASAF